MNIDANIFYCQYRCSKNNNSKCFKRRNERDIMSDNAMDTKHEGSRGLVRKVSLTGAEQTVLSSLMIDNLDTDRKSTRGKRSDRSRSLSEEILLFTPFPINDIRATQQQKKKKPLLVQRNITESLRNLFGSRCAAATESVGGQHEWERAQVHPSADRHQEPDQSTLKLEDLEVKQPGCSHRDDRISRFEDSDTNNEHVHNIQDSELKSDEDINIDVRTDSEVRGMERDISNAELSSSSSWDLSEGGFEHFDTWDVLKDEYAEDFGFGYMNASQSMPCDLDDSQGQRHFHIMGTSRDDEAATPHVMSPPLMDSLLNFVQESLQCSNFWLKYSLTKDGANLDTFLHYVRASAHTVLAIETTKGDVFGCFTNSPWRRDKGYYGDRESFVWKMRRNRMTPCHSLFDQAHIESEIDVFPCSGINNSVQFCSHDTLAVGSGEVEFPVGAEVEPGLRRSFSHLPRELVDEIKIDSTGFAIALESDLLRGTSSSCVTFCSPCLSNSSSTDGVFDVRNLEVWSFTPCSTVEEAMKLEMRQFILQESHHVSSNTSVSSESMNMSSPFSSKNNSMNQFYRRLGEGDENEIDREGWMYGNMMNETRTAMKSPAFMPSL